MIFSRFYWWLDYKIEIDKYLTFQQLKKNFSDKKIHKRQNYGCVDTRYSLACFWENCKKKFKLKWHNQKTRIFEHFQINIQRFFFIFNFCWTFHKNAPEHIDRRYLTFRALEKNKKKREEKRVIEFWKLKNPL